MKRVPHNRYVIFALIAAAGAMWDLGTKNAVFHDLGYPQAIDAEKGFVVSYAPGKHQRFKQFENREGRSSDYLTGWLKFRLLTNFNHGALWGIGQGMTTVFTLASLAALIGIVVWLFVYSAAESRWLTVALALITAGTIGNLWDRLALHGCVDPEGNAIHAVRDFLMFEFGSYQYPIFNFADAFLVTGAIMLGIQSLFPVAEAKKTDASAATPAFGKSASEQPSAA